MVRIDWAVASAVVPPVPAVVILSLTVDVDDEVGAVPDHRDVDPLIARRVDAEVVGAVVAETAVGEGVQRRVVAGHARHRIGAEVHAELPAETALPP